MNTVDTATRTDGHRYISVPEAAALAGVSREWLYKLISEGEMIGQVWQARGTKQRAWLVDYAAFKVWLAGYEYERTRRLAKRAARAAMREAMSE